jgi:hypothetical protein
MCQDLRTDVAALPQQPHEQVPRTDVRVATRMSALRRSERPRFACAPYMDVRVDLPRPDGRPDNPG